MIMHVCPACFACYYLPFVCTTRVVRSSLYFCAANRKKSEIDERMEFIGIKNFTYETKGMDTIRFDKSSKCCI